MLVGFSQNAPESVSAGLHTNYTQKVIWSNYVQVRMTDVGMAVTKTTETRCRDSNMEAGQGLQRVYKYIILSATMFGLCHKTTKTILCRNINKGIVRCSKLL